MKFWTSEYTFNHPWEKVTEAAWRKYPNPMNPSVRSIDVLERQVDKTGILHTKRVISSQWNMPRWVNSIIGAPNIMFANEQSEVDPSKKVMKLRTRNITFCKFIAVDELLVYKPHPEDPVKTLLKQEAVVLVQGVPLSSYMESLLTSTISSNAGKGRMAMEWVLKKLTSIDAELTDLSHTAINSTNEFINSTKKSVDDVTTAAMSHFSEEISFAKRSIDDISNQIGEFGTPAVVVNAAAAVNTSTVTSSVHPATKVQLSKIASSVNVNTANASVNSNGNGSSRADIP